MSEQSARIVYLEDDPGAFALVNALLAADGFACVLEHVEDEAAFVRAISPPPPDLILADFNLPTIDGLQALALKRKYANTTPFIFVSGSLGEDIAISALKNGATDFVLKDSLARLPSAIRRAIAEARQRRESEDAEAQLRMLSQAVEQSPVGVLITDIDGRIVFANSRMAAMTGYATGELVGNDSRILRSAMIAHDVLSEMTDTITRGESWRGNLVNRRKDGGFMHVRVSISPVRHPDGTIRNFLSLQEDITQSLEEEERRRRLEAQLYQAQKLESIGTLAGGIAHDFNNILTGILGYSELAALSLPRDHESQEELREIRSAGMRAKDLVAQILTFSRRNDPKLVPIDLSRPISEALKLIRASTPTTIEVHRSMEPGIVLADPTQIHQVILNLCTNAVHAMRDRPGKLSVLVKKVEVDETLAHELHDIEPGSFMRITVSDTGHGMDEATLARIYDPFFTTKGPGEGTGLGLAIVRGIVANHHGALRVRNTSSEGTTFELYIPLSSTSHVPAEIGSDPPRGRGEEILVVDDEESIANFVAARLQQLNYRVSVFRDSRQALATILASPHRYSAIVTDLTMPYLTGANLVERIHAAGLKIAAVIMSGYDRTGEHTVLPAAPNIIQLAKPFSGDDLARAVRNAIGE